MAHEFLWLFEEAAFPEGLPYAVERALDHAQDWFAEQTTEPWPNRAGTMPEPFALLDGDVLRRGYGDPSSPVLEFAPLRLSELTVPPA